MTNKIYQNVDNCKNEIYDILDFMWDNPETGFNEWKASEFLKNKFEKLGYECIAAQDAPGFYTTVDTGTKGPTVLVFGELDALLCPTHFHADKETGAAHVCGHNAQCAALYGVAAALKDPEVLKGLSGKIKLCAVPAEEIGEIEFRSKLIKDGKISHVGGKREFLSRGYFDDVDLAFIVHTLPGDEYLAEGRAVGLIAKRATYKGVASHAGAAPHLGKNALYAATLGLSAINSVRETFKEEDYIRVHPVITEGGGAVNTIPDRVSIESFVRGLTFDAMKSANEKVNRALSGAAISMGCELEIEDYVGAMPLTDNKMLGEIAKDALSTIKSDAKFTFFDRIDAGSTDMGDISSLIPSIHLYIPGASGIGHGKDYEITDRETACLISAKWQISMIRILLENGAEKAKNVIKSYVPEFYSKEEMFEKIAPFSGVKNVVSYDETGKILISL